MKPRKIGSADWWEALEVQGVSRDVLEELVAVVTSSGQVADPHTLKWSAPAVDLIAAGGVSPSDMPLLIAAGRILHHEQHPGYGALMLLKMDSWNYAGSALQTWIIEQYAAMIVCSTSSVATSAWYSLAVDFCEDHADGNIVLPGLLAFLPTVARLKLLESSVAARWAARRRLMFWALEDPARHPVLARHIGRSAYSGYFNSFDVADARRIASRLKLSDPKQQAWLDERLRAAIDLTLIGVVADGGRVRIALAWVSFAPSWFAGGITISRDGVQLGVVRKFRVSMDCLDPAALAASGAEVWIPQPHPDRAAQWHSVSGRAADWAGAVGEVVRVAAQASR